MEVGGWDREELKGNLLVSELLSLSHLEGLTGLDRDARGSKGTKWGSEEAGNCVEEGGGEEQEEAVRKYLLTCNPLPLWVLGV